MDTAELAINKLIILSILEKVPGITINQLTTLSLETLYMDYFDFVTAYEELCRDHMIAEGLRKSEEMLDATGRPVSRCDLTPAGSSVLATLENRIPLPIRSYLAQACFGWKKDQRLQNTISATSDPDGNNGYLVKLKQSDGIKDLIDLRLTVPDKEMGELICERWQRQPQTVYLSILSLLTGELGIGSGEQLTDRTFEDITAVDPEPGQDKFAEDPKQQTLFEE